MSFFTIFLIALVKFVPVIGLTLYAFHNKLNFSTLKNTINIVILTAILAICSYIFTSNVVLNGVNELLFSTAVVIMSIFIYPLFIRDFLKNISKIIFTIFLSHSILNCIMLTAELYKSLHQTISEFNTIAQNSFVFNSELHLVLFNTIIMLLSVPIIFALIKFYLYPIINIDANMPFWSYLWVIPCSFLFVFRYLVYPGYFGNKSMSPKYVLALSPFWVIFMLAVYFIILKMLLQTANNLQLQKDLEISNVYTQMQKERYSVLQKSFEDMKMNDHDTRHHIVLLQRYIKNNDLASVEKLLHLGMEYLDNDYSTPYCQNHALDSIIWNFTRIAEQNNISMQVNVSIPADIFVNPLDLSIVFGNLIENSIEACCRQVKDNKFINIRAEMITKQIMNISIKNSYNGILNKRNGYFLSSKRDGVGIGIKSVYNIAEKYNGAVEVNFDKSVFRVQVLLNA